MESLSIGQVAERAGIATSAIRYYESEGLLPVPRRRSGRRVYGGDVLDRLRFVELAKAAGFTVAETRKLLRGFSRRTPAGARWRALAEQKLLELQRRIDEAQQMQAVLRRLSACECPTLDDCVRGMPDPRPEGCATRPG